MPKAAGAGLFFSSICRLRGGRSPTHIMQTDARVRLADLSRRTLDYFLATKRVLKDDEVGMLANLIFARSRDSRPLLPADRRFGGRRRNGLEAETPANGITANRACLARSANNWRGRYARGGVGAAGGDPQQAILAPRRRIVINCRGLPRYPSHTAIPGPTPSMAGGGFVQPRAAGHSQAEDGTRRHAAACCLRDMRKAEYLRIAGGR